MIPVHNEDYGKNNGHWTLAIFCYIRKCSLPESCIKHGKNTSIMNTPFVLHLDSASLDRTLQANESTYKTIMLYLTGISNI